jgi:hypothetical protein
MVDENSAAGKAGVNAKEDFSRVTAPDISTKNLLMYMVLTGLNLNQEDYWKDSKVQKQFSNSYGSELRCALTRHMIT